MINEINKWSKYRWNAVPYIEFQKIYEPTMLYARYFEANIVPIFDFVGIGNKFSYHFLKLQMSEQNEYQTVNNNKSLYLLIMQASLNINYSSWNMFKTSKANRNGFFVLRFTSAAIFCKEKVKYTAVSKLRRMWYDESGN